MKSFLISAVALTCFLITPDFSRAQQNQAPDSLGLPGDNLNLYAVMKIFQESKTLEEFERKLNDKENHINNLDLNNDNKVDYIRVVDHKEGENHNIVLQVPVNPKENQDVAVFNVEKNKKGEVTFQLVGDEELYGKDYIIEPNYFEYPEGETPNPAYKRVSTEKKVDEKGNVTIINNYSKTEIAEWPMMLYLFGPGYVFWSSPWYWGYYPPYWYPWDPWYWHQYYGWHINFYYVYHSHYRHNHHYICPHTHHAYYTNIRTVSPFYNKLVRSREFERFYSRPEMKSAGSEIFIKEVESKRIAIPERQEKTIEPIREQQAMPERETEIVHPPVHKEIEQPEKKPVIPVERQPIPEMRDIPRQKAPVQQPRVIKERPAKEIQPKRELKRKTSSARKKTAEKQA